ncbi:hypothetical protein NPIL_547801 [Nephila pilipes]|uniref:Uncharacterized protein n=1 Tax=Nephila pilipes TaxID=299642 RepID=A0A8X6U6T7_NEPPI|nr:hypothetical protein NPIL_547801 [Nephila pilipes]
MDSAMGGKGAEKMEQKEKEKEKKKDILSGTRYVFYRNGKGSRGFLSYQIVISSAFEYGLIQKAICLEWPRCEDNVLLSDNFAQSGNLKNVARKSNSSRIFLGKRGVVKDLLQRVASSRILCGDWLKTTAALLQWEERRRKESAKTIRHSRKRSQEGGAGMDQWHTAPPTATRQPGRQSEGERNKKEEAGVASQSVDHLQVMTVGHGPRRETEKASVRRTSLRDPFSVTFRPNKCVFSQALPPTKEGRSRNQIMDTMALFKD